MFQIDLKLYISRVTCPTLFHSQVGLEHHEGKYMTTHIHYIHLNKLIICC